MGLQTEGIIFMALAWGVIGSVISFCYYKILTTHQNIKVHSESSVSKQKEKQQ